MPSIFRVVIIGGLIHAALLPITPEVTTIMVAALVGEAFDIVVSLHKKKLAINDQLDALNSKVAALEKATNDRMSSVDNKLAGLGISRRNV